MEDLVRGLFFPLYNIVISEYEKETLVYCLLMNNTHTTDEAKKLYETLLKVGVEADIECGDGHKHVDICIPEAKLYIEVEGPPHFLRASQILKDFKRDDYSTEDGYETFRVPNHYIHEHLYKLVGAIKDVVEKRIEDLL